jgi:hypothetical protein
MTSERTNPRERAIYGESTKKNERATALERTKVMECQWLNRWLNHRAKRRFGLFRLINVVSTIAKYESNRK